MEHRTALATAGSVVGVVVAGITAIGANLGILNSNDDGVGQLSASAVVDDTSTTLDGVPVTTVTEPVGASTTTASSAAPTTAPPTASPAAGSGATAEVQSFAVGDAGLVTVARNGATLTVTDIAPNPGWTAGAVSGQGSREVEVDLVGPTRLRFKAEIEDGAIRTRLEDRGTTSGGTSGSGSGTSGRDDDHDDDDGEHHEYEGGEDDD